MTWIVRWSCSLRVLLFKLATLVARFRDYCLLSFYLFLCRHLDGEMRLAFLFTTGWILPDYGSGMYVQIAERYGKIKGHER